MLNAPRQILRNASLRRAEAGWLLAIAAEWAYLVSLLVYAYEVGGIVAVGLVSMVRTLPAALLAPALSTFADRFAGASVIRVVHAGRGAAAGVAAVAVAVDLGAPAVIGAAVAEGTLATLHRPATLSLLPSLARSPDELIAANAATSIGEGTGVLIGPAVGGALLAVAGSAAGLGGAAAMFFAALLVVASIVVPAPSRRSTAGAGEQATGLTAVLGGFRALRRYPYAGIVVALFGAQTLVRGALGVLLVGAAVELLGIGRSGVGWLNSAIGAGGLAGAVLALLLIGGRRLSPPFSISLALWGAPIAVIGLLPQPVLSFALMAVVGAANATLDVSGFTLLQRCVPHQLRGRVFGVLEAIVATGVGVGALVAPLLVERIGLEPALLVTGALLPTVALASYPVLRRADDAAVVPERQLALLRRIPMFAPLSLAVLEQLAQSLEPVRYEPGAEVIREGEPGDRYYVVAAGSGDVVRNGELISRIAAGDGFGEIALLSDVPRTATVVAREPLDGYSLPREAFLAAVTGSPDASRIAGTLVARRLTRDGS